MCEHVGKYIWSVDNQYYDSISEKKSDAVDLKKK